MGETPPSATAALDSKQYQKKNGIYYTPQLLADLMAEWGVRSSTDTILDPSYGGCAMLEASLRVLHQLGAPQPGKQIFGVDIDPGARVYRRKLIEAGVPESNLPECDFMQVRTGDLPVPEFRVILANPPYVRHHRMSEAALSDATAALEETGHVLSKRASYWAYFVLRCIDLLADGGRMAFVLPGAFLHADYASTVRAQLATSFATVMAIRIGQRLFQDAEEETVLVLANRKSSAPAGVTIVDVAGLHELPKNLDTLRGTLIPAEQAGQSWLPALATSEATTLLQHVQSQGIGYTLGELAKIRIGCVTGANRFFIIDEPTRIRWGIPESHVVPIVSHASQLGKGLCFSDAQLAEIRGGTQRSHLILPPDPIRLPPGLELYITQGIQQELNERYKCRLRTPWFVVTDRQRPEAFLTYMSWVGPRIVLNQPRVDCTNAIHRLEWTNPKRTTPAAIALAMLSSLAQLAAEMVGRPYGGGVLKLEPGQAGNLWIPPMAGDVDTLFLQTNTLLNQGQMDEARYLVDRSIQRALGLRNEEIEIVQREIERLRIRRMASAKS